MLTHTQHPRSRTKSRLKKQRSITTTITTTLTMAPPKVTITTRRTTLRRRHDPCPRRRPVAQHSLPRLERRDPLLLDDSLPTAQVRQNLTYTHVRSGSCIGTNAWTRVQCLVGRSTPTASSQRLLRSATYPRTTQAAAMAAFCACRQRRDQRCHRLPSRQCPLLPSHRFAQTAKLDRLHDQVLPHTRTQLTHTHVTDAFS